jgi:hypothetical protein
MEYPGFKALKSSSTKNTGAYIKALLVGHCIKNQEGH